MGPILRIKKALGNKPLILTCEYKHAKRAMTPVVAVLEVDSFAETDAVGSDGERAIKQLTRITDALNKMAATCTEQM